MAVFQFEQLKTMFEALQAEQAGRDPETRDAELLASFAAMDPRFPEEYRAYLATERERIEDLAIHRNLVGDRTRAAWYSGPKSRGIWPVYRDRLDSRLPEDATAGVDESTSQILSQCANPLERGDKRKGLVVGHVQSGKTANYAGLIAKAVDAGYRIVIVLAGMHTNLRAQTQARLDGDLQLRELKNGGMAWYPLTDIDSDIAPSNPVSPVGNQANVIVMVVKKNEKRLANVLSYLKSISKKDPQMLLSRAVLIIDDESDQATPNTKGAKNLVSTINQRIRDIWEEVKTGTYVAYTATPFANIFTNPEDENDLYPDDFAIVLPRPIGYMGADTYFDTAPADDQEEAASPDALARTIPEDEVVVLAPIGRDITDYDPHVTASLGAAIRWFLIATAIRQIRVGKREHSSMLLHTSHRVQAHDRLRDAVVDYLREIALENDRRQSSFKATFESEIDRAPEFRGDELVPTWMEVWRAVEDLISRVQVRVDNGTSDNRVSYPDGDPQTVIAIGGGTLSRGLTLEGLVVSFFLRTSNAYDTLLQMGRWFGFRPHYRDLARVWAASGMLDDYAHLALVERELREDISVMINEGMTPRDIAIPVRAHKGRLQITGAGKMDFVDLVHTGLGGNRRQTIYLDRSQDGVGRTQSAARGLIRRAVQRCERVDSLCGANGAAASHLFEGLSHSDLIEFLEEYGVFPVDAALQPDAMRQWTVEHGAGKSWDLVLASGPSSNRATFDYAPEVRVNVVSRTPLKVEWDRSRFEELIAAGADIVNIRALMASTDSTADLVILDRNHRLDDELQAGLRALNRSDAQAVKSFRRATRPDTGLVILYAIGKDSAPATGSAKTRGAMGAPDHLIGLAVVFPAAEYERDGDYYAVTVKSIFDPGDELSDDDDSEIVDEEADFRIQEGEL